MSTLPAILCTSFLAFPIPSLTNFYQKVANSFSSTADSNGLGSGLSPRDTFPEILSCNVNLLKNSLAVKKGVALFKMASVKKL